MPIKKDCLLREFNNDKLIESKKVKMKFFSKKIYRKLNKQLNQKNPVWIDYNSKVQTGICSKSKKIF